MSLSVHKHNLWNHSPELWPWLSLPFSRFDMLCTSGFVDDVTFFYKSVAYSLVVSRVDKFYVSDPQNGAGILTKVGYCGFPYECSTR